MNIEFIKVDQNDLIEIIETLAREIWHEHYTAIIGRVQVEYMLGKFQTKTAIAQQIQDGYVYYLLRKEDGSYVGYCALKFGHDELFLNRIYIKTDCRGQGFGRQSLDFLTDLAKKEGLSKITLTVNKNNIESIKIYQRMDFKNVGSMIQDIGGGFVMDDYRMEKVF